MLKNVVFLFFILISSILSIKFDEQNIHNWQKPQIMDNTQTIQQRLQEKRNQVSVTLNVQNKRLLQDNPFAPTGEFMNTTPGTKYSGDVLTIDLISQINNQTQNSTRLPSSYSGSLLTSGNGISSLNITLSGINYSSSTSLGNQPWNNINVQDYTYDPFWIAVKNYLPKLNLTYYYPNQILILSQQNSNLGSAFNVTFRSVKGFINAIVLVNRNYIASLVSSTIFNSFKPIAVNNNSNTYNVALSLIQSLFNDFTLAPLTLLNGTETKFPSFTLYDLRYRSKNGIYSFLVKTQLDKGKVLGTVLTCSPITISVTTQTMPITTSLNLINLDGTFRFINSTIYNFVEQNLNILNAKVQYNSITTWSNRAGTSILYYFNIAIVSPNIANKKLLVGVNYDLTNRDPEISYWRNAEPAISKTETSFQDFSQIGYLDVVTNSFFGNVDRSARVNYPALIVGPLVKVQTQKMAGQVAYRLTYFGVDGNNVQAAYRPSS